MHTILSNTVLCTTSNTKINCPMFVINLYKRKLSAYVRAARFMQAIKENDEKCLSVIPDGKFLVYYGSKPLIKSAISNNKLNSIMWLNFLDIKEMWDAFSNSCVFLDAFNNLVPRFYIQIKKNNDNMAEQFCNKYEGYFADLRTALFTLSRKEAQIISKGSSLLYWHRNSYYCGRCSAPTEKSAAGNFRTCSKCGHISYPTSHPVGIVLVTDQEFEHALLVRQPRHPRGMFTCIAGFSDAGETVENTVKREVAEETGLEVLSVNYVASQHWPFPGSLMLGCYASTIFKEPDIDKSELDDARWFSRRELAGAVEKLHHKSAKFLQGGSDEQLFIPPPGAIAHHLISHWVKKTPIFEIQKFIDV